MQHGHARSGRALFAVAPPQGVQPYPGRSAFVVGVNRADPARALRGRGTGVVIDDLAGLLT
jgi:hypothetical protein